MGLGPDFLDLRASNAVIDDLEKPPGLTGLGNLIDRRQGGIAGTIMEHFAHVDNGNLLENRTFERVGGERTVSTDVRVISAANRDLKREVERKNFREELYYRLNVVPIELPPLRERKNDIPLLAEEFLKQAGEQGQKTAGLSKKGLSIMMDYLWPGNVRELQNALHYALVKCKGRRIRAEDLPLELRAAKSRRGPMRKLNPEMVRAALDLTGGNKAKAARHLGVGRATLYRFLEEFPDVS